VSGTAVLAASVHFPGGRFTPAQRQTMLHWNAAGVERVVSAEDDSSVAECRREPLTTVSHRPECMRAVCEVSLRGLLETRRKS
jgi:hypothetical protein